MREGTQGAFIIWLLVIATSAILLIVLVAALLARSLWKASADGSTEALTSPLLGESSVQMREVPSSMTEDGYFALFASWRDSERQLMVLDHDLRIVLWSKGMAAATHGMAPGTNACRQATRRPPPTAHHQSLIIHLPHPYPTAHHPPPTAHRQRPGLT